MQDPLFDDPREQVAAACRRLAAAGLVDRTGGNVSVRVGEHVAITPTGAELAQVTAADVPIVDLGGRVVDGALAPTSEIDLHLAVLAHHDAGAVVHSHAPFATAVACVVDELPAIHYEMVMLGGPVRVAPYETFGTPALAAAAVEALEGRSVALLANHGTIAFGPDVDAAVRATELLEWAATLYWRASQIGTPHVLDEEDLRAVIDAAVERKYGTTKPAEEHTSAQR